MAATESDKTKSEPREDVAQRPALPTPLERPAAHVLIFDGHCRFCQGQVTRIHRWDSRQRVAFLSLHDPLVSQRYPDLSFDMLMEQMYLIDTTGQRHAGAAAFRYLTLVIPRLFLLAPVMYIPFSLPIWSWFYRQVAKRRYRWGKTDACDNGVCELHLK